MSTCWQKVFILGCAICTNGCMQMRAASSPREALSGNLLCAHALKAPWFMGLAWGSGVYEGMRGRYFHRSGGGGSVAPRADATVVPKWVTGCALFEGDDFSLKQAAWSMLSPDLRLIGFEGMPFGAT